ncbi:MAG: GNAT family N-acetyltransferase [Chitinimonas sp.]|nr:GNAT family N-acetyltransferase [Chitinimonas sp.]
MEPACRAGKPMQFPLLGSTRLLLREITVRDADAIFAIQSDPEVMRWFGADPMQDRQQALQLIEMFANWRTQPNPGTRWGIVHRQSGVLMGTAGLFRWNRGWRNCVLGYELGRPHWGHGYMQEALQTLLDYGVDQMALNRIQAEIHPDNHASVRLVQKLGFQYEGRHRQQGYWGGKFHDLDSYSLLAQDWPAVRQASQP